MSLPGGNPNAGLKEMCGPVLSSAAVSVPLQRSDSAVVFRQVVLLLGVTVHGASGADVARWPARDYREYHFSFCRSIPGGAI